MPSHIPKSISDTTLPVFHDVAARPDSEFAAGRDGLPTAGGGLLFTLPLLERLNFAGWLGDRPALAAARLPERLLLLLAQGARLPPEDPWAAWLACALEGAPAAEGADDACRLWRSGLRGWLARRARMPLRDLILRPGTLSITPTHVDVTFDMAQADLRVRRLGLDVDPGWVAWWGHVVRFHYSDGTAGK